MNKNKVMPAKLSAKKPRDEEENNQHNETREDD
jgi:hypothetical protein